MRKAGVQLACSLLLRAPAPEAAPELRAAILVLRHDKIDVVREAVAAATSRLPEVARAAEQERAQKPRDPNRSPATRTPVRTRALSSLFDAEGSSEEPVIRAAPSVAAEAARRLSEREQREGDGGALLSEVRTIKKQQEELLAVIGGLTRAVEAGMRTLNSRVRALEEQMQDLETALVSRSE